MILLCCSGTAFNPNSVQHQKMSYQKKISPLTKNLLTGFIVLLTGIFSAAAQHTPDANGIIYVREGAIGEGNSWANATGDFQEAVNAAGVTQVWVAKGTYQPVSGQSFTMKQGVAIYGGFPNNNDHTGMDDRDWATHLTTLQGNGNSVVKNEDNALTPADILDGFTITGGSGDYGGGILNINSSPSYTNLVITGNNVNWYGGGMLIAGAATTPRITNVLISSNSAVGYGGGVNNSSSPVFTNVTISGNTAYGGSEWNEVGTAAIRNSVIYGNGVNGQLNDVQNSLVQNQTNTAYTNAANHNLPTDTDPLFTDPDGGNYSPLSESPVINKGNNTLFDGLGADTKDLVGNTRLFDTTVDMGAYECQILQPVPDANGIVYIRQGGTGDGSSWANATGYLQGAINAAGVTQVWVAKGTYQPRSGQSFTMTHGVAIYGGFPDNDDHAGMNDRNWSAHVTTLKGNGNSVVTNVENALTPADVLDGFTITGGTTFQYGGGIFNYNASPVYANLVITGNTAYTGGGIAIYEGAAPHLINVLISGNTAAAGGGGINASSPLLTNVTISGNTSSVGIGGAWVDVFGTAIIRNSIIYGGGVGGEQLNDIQNSLVQNQTDAAYTDAAHHNLPTDTDPLFTNPALGMYTLQPSSPAVNKGSNAFFAGLNAHTKDLAGNPRVYDFPNSGVIDMGAYESQVVPPEPVIRVVYVRQGGTGDGSSWAQAMGDFQGAIDVADVEQVWVAQGAYQPVSGRPFIMKRGVTIYGGFPNDNDQAGMDDRDWAAHPTTLQGNEKCVIENENNALTPADILDGFIITGGKAPYGAGIMNFNSSPSYINLVITGNEATLIAGGIMISLAAPRLTNVLVSGNTALLTGGVATSGSSSVFTNVTVSGNTASEGVGEWFDETGTSVIRNSIIYGNGVEGQMENTQNSLVQNQTNAAYGDVANNNLPTSTDPLFTNPAGGDYTLKPGSPAINNGSNAFFEGLNADTRDLAGSPRLVGSAIDMGTFESPDGALPVRWISFEGRFNEQRRAVLTWKTEETNVSHYEVERSANAKNFYVTGTVTAGGTGSVYYSHTDPAPVLGRVYYRIRQVDLDGTFSYSQMISLAAEGRSELFAYPNPARDRIAVELGSEYIGSKARLISVTGVVLQQIEVKEEILTLEISRHASGIYLLQLHDGKVVKLIKE